MARKKTVKPVSYKAALRSTEAYYRQYNAGKIIQSKTMENFAHKVGRYLDKEGNIKKDLTPRQIANFNKLVTTFKESDYSTIDKLKRISKKAEERFVENHAGKTMQEARSVRQIMTEANNAKKKIDSDMAIALTDEMEDRPKITNDEFMNIFYEYINRKKSLVPKDAQKFIGGDDTLNQIQQLLNIYETLDAEGKNELVIMIKDNATLAQIKEYFASKGKKDAKYAFVKGHLVRIKDTKTTNRAKKAPTKRGKENAAAKPTKLKRKVERKQNNGILY